LRPSEREMEISMSLGPSDGLATPPL
jgi:hypothetical protein